MTGTLSAGLIVPSVLRLLVCVVASEHAAVFLEVLVTSRLGPHDLVAHFHLHDTSEENITCGTNRVTGGASAGACVRLLVA